jgi:radical SAM superfamily enzyme YgiQ (UPF0313 family)
MSSRRRVVLAQLPIPQPGLDPVRGNVPLAAGYLKMYAASQGLEAGYDIEILPPAAANTLGDRGLVTALLERDPWMVGFTCYLWNVERTLWVAEQLKSRRPDIRILVGGPEITSDNAWVLDCPHVDYAALGEGEQTFAQLLSALRTAPTPATIIPGLWVAAERRLPPPRTPLPQLDIVTSPYLTGILDAADERMLLLETLRGCVFRCKFCFYPKSYDDLYFASEDKIAACLQHAREHGAREVILLDPTLNQRRDFAGFLRLLARNNPERRFTYFGELRAEGIDAGIAALLRDANFTEVEIGLQSIDPKAQTLMDRRNNMRAFERGVGAMLDAGIRVKIDLIVGLPGDTPETVRAGMQWVHASGLYSDVQVFNLAILPGTAFREEATSLGLKFQPRPPYYVLQTPAIGLADSYALMAEAESLFDIEFDAMPAPRMPAAGTRPAASWIVDLDAPGAIAPPPSPAARAQAFTLWLRGRDLPARRALAIECIDTILRDNPYTTLQLLLEPLADPRRLDDAFLDALLTACHRAPTYLDRFYAVLPGAPKGAKRLVLLLPASQRASVGEAWIETVTERAAILWSGAGLGDADLFDQEYSTAAGA